jgi:Acetyltransferase (GNAT) family
VISYQQEFLATCWREGERLIPQHWSDAGNDGSPDIDVRILEHLEQLDALRIFTMRSDGQLVGYALMVITPSTHLAGRTLALCDGIYIDKPMRGLAAVGGLLRFAEECLREDGVKEIRLHAKAGTSLGSLFARFGYTLAETVHTKGL